MKIKVDQFCSLSTSPTWTEWLRRYDLSIAERFAKKMNSSQGCARNREIMEETLDEIEATGGTNKLVEFISVNYPYMVDDGPVRAAAVVRKNVPVFGYYNPGILTYPRRIIIKPEGRDLRRAVQEFIFDKLKHDSIIVDNVAYIEYLTHADADVLNKIPSSNWKIAEYRLRAVVET